MRLILFVLILMIIVKWLKKRNERYINPLSAFSSGEKVMVDMSKENNLPSPPPPPPPPIVNESRRDIVLNLCKNSKDFLQYNVELCRTI